MLTHTLTHNLNRPTSSAGRHARAAASPAKASFGASQSRGNNSMRVPPPTTPPPASMLMHNTAAATSSPSSYGDDDGLGLTAGSQSQSRARVLAQQREIQVDVFSNLYGW
jgi:hypothetical protein